jgi:phosphoribosylformylglycinamidine cyclo-ligase
LSEYRRSGVDLDGHAALVRRIAQLAGTAGRPEVIGGVGLFSGACAVPSGVGQPVLVASTDSVGTKVLLAAACGRYGEVGRDVVVHCANDVATSGASPLFFLDYLAVASLDPGQVLGLVEGVAAACRDAGCALLGGETAQLPDLYREGAYDLAGTMVGVVERAGLVQPRGRVGDVVVGLPSAGLHTNGFSLVRRVLRETGTDPRDHADRLLAPSRLYSGDVRRVLEAGVPVRGMAHITGGGLPGNLDRALPGDVDARLECRLWDRPEVFGWLQGLGGIPEEEMRRVFNLGIGFCLVVPSASVPQTLACLPDARVIGELVPGTGQVELR